MGTYEAPSTKDMEFMQSLLNIVEKNNIPAPSPIEQVCSSPRRSLCFFATESLCVRVHVLCLCPCLCFFSPCFPRLPPSQRMSFSPAPPPQRWTSASRSPMSVAHSESGQDTLFGWVGIIMYLCSEVEQTRQEITEAFRQYSLLMQESLSDPFEAEAHWAKLQIPKDEEGLAHLRARILRRFPIERFNALRREFDPKNILSNAFIDTLFGVPARPHQTEDSGPEAGILQQQKQQESQSL